MATDESVLASVIEQFPISAEPPRDVPLAYINTFGQQRPGRNSRQDDLTRSIRAIGVLQPGLGVVMDETELHGYVEFTNTTWHEDRDPDSFTPLAVPETPTLYVALIAGHSRLMSQRIIAAEDGIDEHEATLPMRFRYVPSIAGLLAIQAGENVHSEPPADRAARGFAEAFLWEKTVNPKLTRDQFARQSGLPLGRVSDAIKYAELPPHIRRATDDGGLPFSLAVELARATDPIANEVELMLIQEYGEDLPEEANARRDELMTLELERFIVAFNTTRNVTRARMRIRAHAKALRASQRKEKDSFQLMNETRQDPFSRIAYLRDEIGRDLKAVRSHRSDAARILHQHAVEILGEPELAIDETTEAQAVQLGEQALAFAMD